MKLLETDHTQSIAVTNSIKYFNYYFKKQRNQQGRKKEYESLKLVITKTFRWKKKRRAFF